jgi:uncharacterized MAPEG superfamily protein
MRTETLLLAAAALLGICQLFIATAAATRARGAAWNLSNREGPAEPLTGCAFRLDQAFKNFLETFPFFAAGVLAALAENRVGGMVLWGAHLYFWARLAYLPVYAAGITGLRTLVWVISMAGIGLVWIGLVSGL